MPYHYAPVFLILSITEWCNTKILKKTGSLGGSLAALFRGENVYYLKKLLLEQGFNAFGVGTVKTYISGFTIETCHVTCYTMIRNIKHRGLRKLYQRGDRSGLRSDIADKAELYLSILDAAENMDEMNITGFGFHALKGNMRGLFSVSVSRNHRIVFGFEDGEVFDVDLVDYH